MRVPFARLAFVFAFLAVAAYAVVTLRGPKGVPALVERQRQIAAMEQRNAALAQEIERKREHINRLENDPAEQERAIRERLKLVHKGEKIYIVGPDNSDSNKKQ